MDKLKQRRSRWEDGDTHPIKITPRKLDLLHELFHLLGPVNTSMLHELAAKDVTINATRERLKHMKLRPNKLIEQPKQQRLSYNANYAPLTYKLTKAGVQVLLNYGRITPEEGSLWQRLQQNYKNYYHDATTTYCIASIKLGCIESGHEFLGWEYTLTHPKCPDATKRAANPLAMSLEIENKRVRVIPDWPPFAIGLPNGRICRVIETDMQSMPINAHELARSSYGVKLHHYLEILRSYEYQRHFGIPNLQILTATVSDIHMQNIMRHLERIVKHRNHARPFLFQSIPYMSKYENRPVISGHLFTSAWHRVGEPAAYLNR
jgi:hypothetical protein